jgi:hypothetical protein
MIDKIVIGEKPQESYGEDVKPVMDSFLRWKESSGLKFVLGDTTVISTEFGYAGSCDAIARNADGRLVILDWKTTGNIQPTYAVR